MRPRERGAFLELAQGMPRGLGRPGRLGHGGEQCDREGGAGGVDFGSKVVGGFGAGFGDDGVFDQVAGEAQVAFGLEGGGTLDDGIDAAGERHPFEGLFAARGGQQVVGLTIVPAAVEAPDVADDELRMVVNRA